MRVLLADNHAAVRSALRLLLEQEDDIEIVGEAEDQACLLKAARCSQPDILLLDWGLTSDRPNELVAELRDQLPCLGIVVLSSRPEARQEAESVGLGHFVSKNAFSEELLAAMHILFAKSSGAGS